MIIVVSLTMLTEARSTDCDGKMKTASPAQMNSVSLSQCVSFVGTSIEVIKTHTLLKPIRCCDSDDRIKSKKNRGKDSVQLSDSTPIHPRSMLFRVFCPRMSKDTLVEIRAWDETKAGTARDEPPGDLIGLP